MGTSSADQYDIWALICQTQDAVSLVAKKHYNASGLNDAEIKILFVVTAIEEQSENPATPVEIARWLMRKRNSISELITRMEKKNLVKKMYDLKRKNTVRITLTGKGKQMYENICRKNSIVEDVLSVLSDEEKTIFRDCLFRLRKRAFEHLQLNYEPPIPTASTDVKEEDIPVAV